MVKALQVTDPLTYHGEGAVWFEGWGGLKWVDMLAGDVLSLDSSTGAVGRLHVNSSVAAMVRPRAGGGFVVATEREFALWRDDEPEWVSAPLWPEGDGRFNEGGCDPLGGLICGMKASAPEQGAVFALSANRAIERVLGGVTVSNGLGFTADGSRMYYNDSPTRRTDVFDVIDGTLTNRRPFVTLPDGVGGPDGLWVDQEDGIWVAMFRGSAVRHYDSTGALQEIVELPVSQVSSCTFGGSDLRTLYITTSREGLPDDVEPAAGSVFGVEVGVAGQPVIPFAG